MLRRISIRLALLCIGACVASPHAIGASEDVVALADEAIAQNPGLASLRARTTELSALADISYIWSDPRVSVEYLNVPVDSFSIDDHPMAGVQFKLQQRLPGWGIPRATKQVALHRVERSRHAADEAALQLRRSVESLYWRLTLSRQLERVTQDHLDRTSELQRAVRARYEVGRSGQNTLLRLDVLRDRLTDDLGDFARVERELSAGLARTLARPADSRFETENAVSAVAPADDFAHWIELARHHRPELAAIREEIEQEQKAAALARVQTRPDVDVWVKYRLRTVETPTDDGTDFFSAGLSVPIPWGSRKRSRGREAASFAAQESARARLAAAIDRIEAELVAVDASWRRAAEKAATYKDRLIPQAVVALETTLSDFSVGKADFSTLYEAEIDLLDLERAYLSATIETHLQRAAARAATGRADLPGGSS